MNMLVDVPPGDVAGCYTAPAHGRPHDLIMKLACCWLFFHDGAIPVNLPEVWNLREVD